MPFLPMSPQELKARNWSQADIILISGDAYIDHPSFGAAIIGRSLEAAGFKVAIIAQPDWTKDEDFLRLGAPRLFFGITAGNMDSMVNHYTAQKKIRHDDAYSPAGVAGKRPDRASLIYTNKIKQLFKGVPVVLGGIEASLRRISHYDYWSDTIKNSILSDSKADLLVYGMAEPTIVEIARYLDQGKSLKELKDLRGTVVFDDPKAETDTLDILPDAIASKDKLIHHQLYRRFFERFNSHTLYQMNGGRWIRHNPPALPLTEAALDAIYALPFENAPHPFYQGQKIPAWEQIKDSITSHRGCYGGCNFCAIGLHQGRKIQSRSDKSIINEAKRLSQRTTGNDRFHGSISDIGGPTANMYASFCKLGFPESCKRRSCLFPEVCPNLVFDHKLQLKMLDAVSKLPGIRHIFISSGIRFDMAIKSQPYIKALAERYTGGRLKLAPEHVAHKTLSLMGKPDIGLYEDFSKEFFKQADSLGLKRQIIPYIIIGHPGTSMEDAQELSNWLKKNRIKIEQVQEFTPTPMTISTCMYFTGLDFETGKPIFVPKGRQIREQKNLALWWQDSKIHSKPKANTKSSIKRSK